MIKFKNWLATYALVALIVPMEHILKAINVSHALKDALNVIVTVNAHKSVVHNVRTA